MNSLSSLSLLESLEEVSQKMNKCIHPDFKWSLIQEVGEIEITTDESVALSLMCMDIRYNTRFREFLTNPKNMDFCVSHLKRIIYEYSITSSGRALRTITRTWNSIEVASFLIKLFYKENMMKNKRFIGVASELCVGRTGSQKVELISTLVIGETPENTGIFIKNLAKYWDKQTIFNIVRNIANCSQWGPAFYENFLMAFTNQGISDPDVVIKNNSFIQDTCDRWKLSINYDNQTYLYKDAKAFFEELLEKLVFNRT
jgi:hypothetical protein